MRRIFNALHEELALLEHTACEFGVIHVVYRRAHIYRFNHRAISREEPIIVAQSVGIDLEVVPTIGRLRGPGAIWIILESVARNSIGA